DNVGQPRESIFYLGKAVQMLQDLGRNETKNRRFKYDLATAYIRLGDARYKQKDFRNSIGDLERASALLTELSDGDASDNASLRNLANANDSIAKSYEGLAAQATGAERQVHRQKAKQSYQGAVDALHRLESKNALSKYDRQSLESLQAILQKYEQEQ
ncbi:MAG: hypothetical protein M3R68_01100, partial [Acidobacteriota bacterium]|nr:hypothetical protein [Acidobacteriota bacterium]